MTFAWLWLALGYAAVLVALEYRRPDRSCRRSRMLAVATVVAALAALANTHVTKRRGSFTLLTPGAPLSARSRDAVGLDQVSSPGAALAYSRSLRLVGWGLLPAEWPDSLMLPVTFEPAPLPIGITALEQPTQVAVGGPLTLRGRVELGPADRGWVILEDPSGPRDSARVTAAAPGFVLLDRPRAAGAASYRLRLRGPGLPQAAETLGVAVRQDRPPSVLVLDASPSFETAFLKRWLASRGARATIRTALSRGRYRTEHLNDGGPDLGRVTPALLASYDLVLADGGSLASLAPAERAWLARAVQEEGLGLLLTADPASVLGEAGLLPFVLEAPPGDSADRSLDRRVVRPSWADAPRRSRTGIEAEAQSLARSPGLDPIVGDEAGRILAAAQDVGRGRVGVTLLRAPSRWVLEGEDELFASYWLGLLAAVARDTVTRVAVSAEGPIRPDLPVAIRLIDPRSAFRVPRAMEQRERRNAEREAEQAGSPVVAVIAPSGVTDTIPLAQDPFDPRAWTGRYWPREAGWHELRLRGGRRVPFRVTHAGEWLGLEASARLAASSPRRGVLSPEPVMSVSQAWLRGLSFLLMLLVLSALWTENRRRPG